jgi:amino acid transporter
MAMTSVLSREELGWVLKPEGLPIPHILYGKKLLGNFGLYFMILMALFASLTSINAGLMTSSRFLYAMARDWSLPKFMARLHPAYATPWVAMVIVTLYCVAVTAFGFITRYILCMILIIAAAECMIYIVIALCVIRLRRTEPDRERGFKIKGGIAGPMLVVLIYGVVGGFVLFGPVKPEDVIDQKIALFFILGLLSLATFYVFAVLPGMREKYRKQSEARSPRRRRKE